ncbi:MAG: hypothetical protein E7491_04840 [Ruminococcaceae bacterium]|nr:hypothetical protein [Oscillospiraceae bacterium]
MDLATRLGFSENLVIALLGMAVVFAILLILFIVLKIFGAVFSKSTPKQKEQPAKAEQAVAPQSEPVSAPAIAVSDETELIAVISAAIAASMNKSASEIRVVSFRKAKTK